MHAQGKHAESFSGQLLQLMTISLTARGLGVVPIAGIGIYCTFWFYCPSWCVTKLIKAQSALDNSPVNIWWISTNSLKIPSSIWCVVWWIHSQSRLELMHLLICWWLGMECDSGVKFFVAFLRATASMVCPSPGSWVKYPSLCLSCIPYHLPSALVGT